MSPTQALFIALPSTTTLNPSYCSGIVIEKLDMLAVFISILLLPRFATILPILSLDSKEFTVTQYDFRCLRLDVVKSISSGSHSFLYVNNSSNTNEFRLMVSSIWCPKSLA